MNIPVITVHSYGAKPQKNDYTSDVIKQSAYFKNTTFSITDYTPSVPDTLDCFENISFKELITKDYELFMENYVHMSTNTFNFERSAIAKFFLIREFMARYKYDKIFHIDSDVLLYSHISSFIDYYNHYDFTLSRSHQCSNSFFTLDVISMLCDKILKIYCDKENYFWFNDLRNIYTKMQQQNLQGGVCDMTILQHYKQRKECNNTHTCGEMSEVIDDWSFDHQIRQSYDYSMCNGRKDIRFINNVPVCYNAKINKNVRFYSLHFQGAAKEYLDEYTTYNIQ